MNSAGKISAGMRARGPKECCINKMQRKGTPVAILRTSTRCPSPTQSPTCCAPISISGSTGREKAWMARSNASITALRFTTTTLQEKLRCT